MPYPKINIISSFEIDKAKWDNCINKAENSLIYSYSFYLDQMADNWHGVILNDYDAVMPITWRKKFGIRYCYDVPFIQQLGIFDSTKKSDLNIFIEALYSFTKYGDYKFNYHNNVLSQTLKVNPQTNYIIELNDKESVKNNLSKSFLQSLHKAQSHPVSYTNATASEAIDLYKQLYSTNVKNVTAKDLENLQQLCHLFTTENKCFVRKVVNAQDEILSITLLIIDGKRLYNIMNATTAAGRKIESNYILYSEIFNEFSGKNLLFDLEGSELPGVKAFYKKMRATEQPYFRLHINNLPFPLNKFKE